MRMYHYTSARMVDGILRSDLSMGHMNTPDGMLHQVVWLTTDPTAEGHGLTNGSELLSDRSMQYLKSVVGERPKNRQTTDKMKVRLTFDIPDAQMYQLIPFKEYCNSQGYGELFSKLTGLSCYIDTKKFRDKQQVKQAAKKIPTKEHTWWISFASISSSFVTAVELRDHDGNFRPYAFETLARAALEELGFYSPSTEALAELQSIVAPCHSHGYTKGLVICPKPDAQPVVIITGGLTDLLFEIDTGRSLTKPSEFDNALAAWVAKYRGELKGAWEKAVSSYFSFYPEQRQ